MTRNTLLIAAMANIAAGLDATIATGVGDGHEHQRQFGSRYTGTDADQFTAAYEAAYTVHRVLGSSRRAFRAACAAINA